VWEPIILLLELLVFEHKPRPWVRNLTQPIRAVRAACGRLYQRVVLLARRPLDLAPDALPPGTASAIATAMQPLAGGSRPFVNTNNSTWMLEEFARQQRSAWRASMGDSSMWRNAALLDSPPTR